jgi:hypothetical protein
MTEILPAVIERLELARPALMVRPLLAQRDKPNGGTGVRGEGTKWGTRGTAGFKLVGAEAARS